jgi:hypothetical protein
MSSPLILLAVTSAFLASPALQAQQDTEQRIAELERQLRSLDEEMEALQFGEQLVPPVQAQGQAGLAPAASKVYGVQQGLSIGGYGEMLYTDRDSGTQLDLYRAIVYLGYRFDENWLFNSEIEWEHGDETAVEFAYLEYQHDEHLNVRIGHQLVPMGFVNQLHEPTTFLSPNRPLIERYILPSTWHENGVAVYGSAGDFDYQFALMNGFDAEDFDLENSGLCGGRQKGSKADAEDLAAILRLDWHGVDGLWLGGSVYLGDSGQSSGAQDFATTVFELHAQYEVGGFISRAVYAAASVDGAAALTTPSPSDDLSGYYLDLGYDVFADRGTESSLTPYLRYSAYDLSEDSATDSEVTRLMLGLAWQPIPQLIFKAAFTQEEQGAIDDNILELSTGYVF